MRVLIAGNPEYGLAEELYQLYPDATYCSRSSGYDLCKESAQREFAELSTDYDVVIVLSALWKFQQTIVLDEVYSVCKAEKAAPHIIAVGSTTDRVKNGRTWRYNAEKKALRDWSNTLGIAGVWTTGLPKVSYISFGTLSNNAHKHPDRRTMDIKSAAGYIKWLIDQPKYVNINEISIDPMQGDEYYD